MKTLALALLLAAPAWGSISLPDDTLFTVHRTNYKTHKTLVYEGMLTAAACQFDTSRLVDAYYLAENSPGQVQREEMSPDSRKYFAPEILPQTQGPNGFEFTFEALKQSEALPAADRKVIVRLHDAEGECLPFASMKYKGQLLRILDIEIELKKVFGVPMGVNWVRVAYGDLKGPQGLLCLHGTCPK